MQIKNVLVLTGGPSLEHDISLASGREIVKHLDSKKYNVMPVVISKDNNAWILTDKAQFVENKKVLKNQKAKIVAKTEGSISVLKQFKQKNGIDLCFIALHGSFGEDGKIQAILDFVGIPYTGSGMLSSALGMNKMLSRKIFANSGLLTPKTIVTSSGEKIEPKIKYPVVVKPNDQGSSIGVFIVKNQKELSEALKKTFKISEKALIEEYIAGTEVTCAVLGNEKPYALPVVEIIPKEGFFDYEAKYNESKCDEIVPARISKRLTRKTQEIAITAFKALECQGFARIDMIIKGDKVYILELNTIPGLTSVSLLPKAAKSAGIEFSALLDKMISYGLE